MWSFHDNLRDQIRLLNSYNSEKNTAKIIDNIPYLIEGIKRLLSIEDMKLFPNSPTQIKVRKEIERLNKLINK